MRERPLDGLCHSLAIFDWQGTLDIAAWRDVTVAFLDHLKVTPDVASFRWQDGRKRQFNGARAGRWSEQTLQPSPISVSLHATEPDYHQLVFGWWVTANVHANEKIRNRSMFWGWRADLALTLEESIELLAAPLSSRMILPYGFAYTLPFRRGPGLDSHGMEAGLPSFSKRSQEDKLEAERIANWARDLEERKRHLEGLLRDLYPINLISAPHLAKEVEGRPLQEWIAAAPGRGALMPLAGGLWQWRLTAQEIGSVRPKLVAESLLIAELPFPQAWQ